MPFDFKTHNAKMVDHFLWLETAGPRGYARDALATYCSDPNCPNPNILADVKAEKTRRLTQPTPASESSYSPTDQPALPTTLARK